MKLQCSIIGMTTLCLAVALLAGCSSSPRVTFYTLNVAAANEASAPAIDSVAIGPITLPDLLDRPQLVVLTSASTRCTFAVSPVCSVPARLTV